MGTSQQNVRTTLVRTGVTLALLASLLGTTPAAEAQGPAVVINEFVASNTSSLADNTGQFPDWIELHNPSGSEVDLDGWTLSAGNDVHTFAPITIAAGEYLVVFASGDATRSLPTEIHVDFKLSAGGESLVLADDGGAISSPSWPGSYPGQVSDISYGRDNNGELFFFDPPSPGVANGDGLTGFVAPVTFSVDHGFYEQAQSVVLSTATSAATIRYTTDGSTPTTTNGTPVVSGSAIVIEATTVLRAVASRSGWVTSAVETRSYLFPADIVEEPETTPPGWPESRAINNMRAFYGIDADLGTAERAVVATALTAIPSISITTDLDNLFDAATGIWTNPLERGPAWERPISIELIDPTGSQPGFEINGGLRIKGNGSRFPRNFKHSMRLVFDNDYESELNYPLFGTEGVDVFESLDLKSAQSWSWNRPTATEVGRGTDATWIRDTWNRETQGAMGQLYTRSRYVHTYLNGKYWGLYYTEERTANQYAAQYTGGNESDFDVVKRDGSDPSRSVEARDGQLDDWLSLWPLVADHALSDAEWAQFETEVDVVNLADFYLLSWFAGDSDSTPRYTLDRSNNWIALRNRARVGDAAKWLFVDKDSESALCTNVGPEREPDWNPTPPWNLDASLGLGIADEFHLTPAWLLEAALTRPEFVTVFQDRVQKHMLTPGGALTVPVSQARLDALSQIVDLVIDAEAARWGDTWIEPGFGRANWEPAAQIVRDCFELRTTVIEQYLREDGLWPLSDPPVISPAAGAVDYGTLVSISAPGAGEIWVTTDGSDPLGPNDQPSGSAFVYSGPLVLTESSIVQARILDGDEWSPLASADYAVAAAGPTRMILNEWNAVDSDAFLKNGGSDSVLGTVVGNGGDWFELVVIEDELDIRGWTLEISDNDTVDGLREVTDVFEFATENLLSSLRAGTIITVSEDFADDISYDPAAGDWTINLQANSDDLGSFFTTDSQSNFGVNNKDWQLTIRDESGALVFGPAGEGAGASGVGGTEIGELEADPSETITPASGYDDGNDSTFGEPNGFDGRFQDFSLIRPAITDEIEPDSAIDSPTPRQVLSDTGVTVAGTATDNTGVGAVAVALRNRDTGSWLRADGSYGGRQWLDATIDSPGEPSAEWTYSVTLPPGEWFVTARAEDAAGNRESARPGHRFSIDAVAPDAEDPDGQIDSPILDEVLDGPTVAFGGSATDDVAVSKARLAIRNRDTNDYLQTDGTIGPAFAWVNTTLANPGAPSTDWNLSVGLPDGQYAVTLDVRDSSGKRDLTRARVRQFTVASETDTTPPVATIEAPRAGQAIEGPAIVLSGSASDNVGVTAVRVTVQDTTSKLWLRRDGTFGAFSFLGAALTSAAADSTDWTLATNLPPGSYAVTARAVDAATNTDTDRPKVTFSVTPPPGVAQP